MTSQKYDITDAEIQAEIARADEHAQQRIVDAAASEAEALAGYEAAFGEYERDETAKPLRLAYQKALNAPGGPAEIELRAHPSWLAMFHAKKIHQRARSAHNTMSVEAINDTLDAAGVNWRTEKTAARVRLILQAAGMSGKSALWGPARKVLADHGIPGMAA